MLGVLCLLFIFLSIEIDAAENGRSSFNELVVDGIRRSYILYRPITSNKTDLPLIIVLHGGLGNARYMQKSTGMNEIADSGPFVVVYPNGTKIRFTLKDRRTWNAGNCCGRAAKKGIDDVKFIEKIIEDIGKKIPIDTGRVYVTGHSNGAMMAYRLAAEIPDKIAAIIPVAGTLAIGNFDTAKDIPVQHIHGTADKNVPIAGGKGARSVAGVAHRSLADTIKLITRSRQCQDPEVRKESGGIQISSYRCGNGAPLVLMLIEGGEHAWPGGHGRQQKNPGGRHFSASKHAWEFAKHFSKTSK
jgi:polyhydroxybutyrate depolymerase